MSGIDDIGGQVIPQGEDLNYDDGVFSKRIGEFYHYMLGKLGSSSAAIEPLKKGNSMCEIFGAYGWSEGVRLEKYLVDHFLVRGINHYVPHAFSPMAFPDPDCPPHFYAHGNNPQYRHFGCLMAYTNRVCELITHGRHVAEIAVLYHGEGEWTGKCMFSHKPAHLLADAQKMCIRDRSGRSRRRPDKTRCGTGHGDDGLENISGNQVRYGEGIFPRSRGGT